MPRPNIVFLHVDQLHHRAISAYGCEHVETPGIDRLVRDGYSFDRMHCAMPQCCPSRASWYTGRMSKEHGVVVNGQPIDRDLPDLGRWLRRHGGYDCAYTGKWHVSGRAVESSFDLLPGTGQGEPGDPLVADAAVSFLRERPANPDRPFFLNIGFHNPHDCCFHARPHGGPAKYGMAAKMLDDLPPLPENFDYDYKNPATGDRRTYNFTLQDWRFYRWHYYRLVEMVDGHIQRIYQTLLDSPHAENTLLIFTADHGDGLAYHANVSKGYLEEESWRVPGVVVLPGTIHPRRDDRHLATGVDVAATICDYAQTPPLPKMTIARSWRPLLEGKQDTPWRDYVVGETSIGGVSTSIRTDRCKAIFYGDGSVKVFDMDKDPGETKNLADVPELAGVRADLRAKFREYIGRIEMYRPVPGQPRGLFDQYITWYESIAAGA